MRHVTDRSLKVPSSLLAGGPSLAELDERARDIFRRIVESYLDTGEPVGSRTISRGGVHLSAASIRNTMQDLTQLGQSLRAAVLRQAPAPVRTYWCP